MVAGNSRYGTFRYGEIEEDRRDGPPPRARGERQETPTDEEALGTGIALTPATAEGYDWDFRIGADGAFMSTAGVDEYSKDMAFATAWEATPLLGRRMTAETVADLEIAIADILSGDQRTQSVEAVQVSRGSDPDALRIAAEFTTQNDQHHALVFPVPTR